MASMGAGPWPGIIIEAPEGTNEVDPLLLRNIVPT